jgi:hypothetical protein
MRVREEKTREEILAEVIDRCSRPREGVTCARCGQKTATIYPWPEPTGTCVCPCVTPAWFIDFVKFSSDPARMAEERARKKAERRRRPIGKEALAISVTAGTRTPKMTRSSSDGRLRAAAMDAPSIRLHPPEEPTLPAPLGAFTSPGGRAFDVSPGTRSERWAGDSLWSECWPICHGGVVAGKLFRDLNYGKTSAGEPRWHATIRELYWDTANGLGRLDLGRGIGYDVAAFDTAGEAVAAWARSADQILDRAESLVAPG